MKSLEIAHLDKPSDNVVPKSQTRQSTQLDLECHGPKGLESALNKLPIAIEWLW